MRPRHLLLALGSLLLPLAASAQIGNSTDPGFPGPITGGGANSGSFLGAGLRTENELFKRIGDRVVFRTAKLGCALRGAEQSYRDSVAGAPHSPSQQRVLDLLAVTPGTPPTDAVAAALAHGAAPGTALATAARTLADAMTGLMQDRGGCGSGEQDFPEAEQWQRAIDAFKAYVHDAPDAAFAPPAPELVALHDAILYVVSRTLSDPSAR
jgi:hypothetical protein